MAVKYNSISNKCLILDLDQTCVHTQDDIGDLEKLGIFSDAKYLALRRRVYRFTIDDFEEKKGSGVEVDMWGTMRPHLKEFLVFAQSYFRVVAVWSAGIETYVDNITNIIFRDLSRPRIVYNRNNCDIEDKHYTKPITKMSQEMGLQDILNEETTFILDDRRDTFKPNPNNGILIPEYRPLPRFEVLNSDEIALRQLSQWLQRPEVINSRDIRTLDKSQIFNQSLNELQSHGGTLRLA